MQTEELLARLIMKLVLPPCFRGGNIGSQSYSGSSRGLGGHLSITTSRFWLYKKWELQPCSDHRVRIGVCRVYLMSFVFIQFITSCHQMTLGLHTITLSFVSPNFVYATIDLHQFNYFTNTMRGYPKICYHLILNLACSICQNDGSPNCCCVVTWISSSKARAINAVHSFVARQTISINFSQLAFLQIAGL